MRELHQDQDKQGKDTSFETDTEYWDCECEQYYIHSKSKSVCQVPCFKCGAHADAQPDSRSSEIDSKLHFYQALRPY